MASKRSVNTLVVGGGFGGIAAALRCKALGHNVTLVERLDKLGGRAQVLKIDGYKHDMGPTVITAPFLFQELFQLFDENLDDHLEFVPVSPWYRFVFHNGKEFKFEKNDPTLFFLQRIRDESHRFAISAHRAKRKKGISKSLLDQIEGIGAVRKRSLLNHFGSARAVESASLDEIKSVEGVEEKVAKKIYNFFHE
mgnify:CR=1 FL=1